MWISLYHQNGGKYDFLVDSGGAVPVDASFWDFLLSSSKEQWNLLVYEQDWLYVQVGKVPQLIVSHMIVT